MEHTKLRYEQLIQWEVGEAVLRETVTKWENVGYSFDYLDDDVKEMLAVAFDNVEYDTEGNVDSDEEFVKTLERIKENNPEYSIFIFLHDIIQRVVEEIGVDFNYDDFKEYLKWYSYLSYDRELFDEKLEEDDFDELFECDGYYEFMTNMFATLIINKFEED